MDPLDSLLAQARRLRFADSDREDRFGLGLMADSVDRIRWALVCGCVYTIVAGLGDRLYYIRSGLVEARQFGDLFRWGISVPVWLSLLTLTWWLPARRTLDLWVAFGIEIIAQMTVLGFHYRDSAAVQVITTAVLPLHLLAALVLPLRRRTALLLAFGQAVLAPILYFAFCFPWRRGELVDFCTTNALYAAVIVVAGLLRERTDRRLFAQREHLAVLNGELARLNAERAEFMAIAAHDLRAPLGAVRLTAAHAHTDGSLAPAHRELFTDIAGAAARMGGIVDSFLSAHAAESGSIPVRLSPVDLASAAVDTARRHSAAAAAKRQTLSVARAALPPSALADAALLAQVLDNFLTNAIKFTPPGGAITLHATAGETPATVRLSVRDTGPGLSDTDKARAFAKFARLTAQPTGGEASTGLGLAVSRRLATATGGTVGVADAPGGGAEFWVEFPVAPSPFPSDR